MALLSIVFKSWGSKFNILYTIKRKKKSSLPVEQCMLMSASSSISSYYFLLIFTVKYSDTKVFFSCVNL